MRNTFDFSPYRRSTIGFDRLFDLLETANRADNAPPQFDIERVGEDRYNITLAIPGFRPDEVEIIAQNNQLSVSGRKPQTADGKTQYVHRGIAMDAFERRFQLADFVVVERADFEHGMLRISLKHEIPEAMKPRRIPIGGGAVGPAANDRLEAPSDDRQAAA